MGEIEQLLEGNRAYVTRHTSVEGSAPGRHLAVVTCMDVRIDPLAVLGVHLGDAHVIRNAGGRVTDDVLRSLALSTQVMNVETLVVMQHTQCGLAGVTDEELRARTGADIEFLSIADHEAALRKDIELVSGSPFLLPLKSIAGFLFNVESGGIEEVVRWERPAS